jgi:hypothetical protein
MRRWNVVEKVQKAPVRVPCCRRCLPRCGDVCGSGNLHGPMVQIKLVVFEYWDVVCRIWVERLLANMAIVRC